MSAADEKPQEWITRFNVRGKLRDVTVTCWLEDVDDTMVVVHTLAIRRLGLRVFGYAHFVLMSRRELYEPGPWGERAVKKFWLYMQEKRRDEQGYPRLPFWYLASDRDDNHVRKQAA